VDQGGGLERLAGGFLGQLAGGELAQLLVDERQELRGGLGLALLDGGQELRDLLHGDKDNSPQKGRQTILI
jgi:hypothetical protein